MVCCSLQVLVLLYLVSLGEGEQCTNQCREGKAGDWCGVTGNETDYAKIGQKRLGDGGRVVRCADQTRYGKGCLGVCQTGEEDYTWCRVSAHVADWDYCGLDGMTSDLKPC